MDDFIFNNTLNNDIRLVEGRLKSYLPTVLHGQNDVVKAMKYSLNGGGKRLRPVLTLEFCKCCGGNRHDAIDFACAVEYIHTYSLIHDDLPCIDDDDMRRGKESCHIAFGEDTALLAGDALLTHAFQILADSDMDAEKRIKAVGLLAQNSGVSGMIGGQVLDLLWENREPSVKELLTIHKMKTGALISCAAILGCIAADASEEQIVAASSFAYHLGIAFQIQDDILDVMGDASVTGKPSGSDADNNKKTYVSVAGLDKAKDDVQKLTDRAIESLSSFENTEFVIELATRLINREN